MRIAYIGLNAIRNGSRHQRSYYVTIVWINASTLGGISVYGVGSKGFIIVSSIFMCNQEANYSTEQTFSLLTNSNTLKMRIFLV